MTVKKRFAVFVMFMIIFGVVPTRADVVTVSVAGSMTDVFKKLAHTFQATHPDTRLQLNFGSSGALAKQISHGAPADIFVSANNVWMDYLIKAQKIDTASAYVFAHNTLVFIGNNYKAVGSLADLEQLECIAMGSPKSVPAGQYAEQAMRAARVYETLLAAKKLIMAKDVRQALMYVERREADGAFVYRTDALLAKKAVILFEVPAHFYPRIDYPLAMTPTGSKKAPVRVFFEFLKTRKAQDIVALFGFQVSG